MAKDTKFISANLLSKAQEANVAKAYRAKDVLANIKKNDQGVFENVPVGLSFLETRTPDGVEGTFVEIIKED